MKNVLKFWALIVLIVLITGTCAAQEQNQPPRHLSVFSYAYDSDASLGWIFPRPARTCGVWVAVFNTDPAVEAIQLTVYYTHDGRELSRTQTVEIQRKGTAGWTNWLFSLASAPVTIRSILVVPLVPAGESRTVPLGAAY